MLVHVARGDSRLGGAIVVGVDRIAAGEEESEKDRSHDAPKSARTALSAAVSLSFFHSRQQ